MNCIVTVSGKGGTGKSCVAAYTAAALAKEGRKTLIVEMGADSRSLDLILGASGAPFGIHDALAGRCTLFDATVKVEGAYGLEYMGAGDITEPPDTARMAEAIRTLKLDYDFVIVDGADLASFPVSCANIFLMVVTPDTLCMRASSDLARRLRGAGAREIRLVINSVPARIIPIEGAEDFDDLIDRTGAQLIAVIPQSPRLRYCANNSKELDPESLTVKVFDNLAGRLMGQRRHLLIR
ncbi:MAG: P-loop NTPase [Oscillospiraceae bacterium]|nr:P-loop NTPase [Oscillospiraceae bacterium]